MIHLWKDPKGETVLEPSSPADTYRTTNITTTEDTDPFDEVAGLKQQISELQKKLTEVLFTYVLITTVTATIYLLKVNKEKGSNEKGLDVLQC